MNRTSNPWKWLTIILAALILIGVGISLYLTPYFALYNMRTAAERHDATTFSSYIDFPVFKENFKAELNAKMMSEMVKNQQQNSNPFAGLGMLLAANLVNNMVDAFVSPAGIERAMRGDFQIPNPTNQSAQDNSTQNKFPSEETHTITYSYDSFNDFSITLIPKANPNNSLKLIFQRRGLFGWQLINLKMS